MERDQHAMSRMRRFFRIIDIFPQELGFTHKQLRAYKSTSSGVFSLLTLLCILSYFLYLGQDIWNKKMAIKNSFRKRDVIFDNTSFDTSDQNFDFAISLQYIGVNASRSEYLHRFISLNINQIHGEWEKKNGISVPLMTQVIPIEVEKCRETALNNDTRYLEELGLVGLSYCPATKNFTLKGGLQSQSQSVLQISIRECSQQQVDIFHPGEVCASLEEQQDVASKILVTLIAANQYFSGENILEPIQQDYKVLSLGVPYQQSFYTFMKYSINYAILEDSWIFESYNARNISYSSVRMENQYGRAQQPYNPRTPYMMINFLLDENVNINERTAFNLVMAVQQIGGFASVCMAVARILFSFTQKYNFYNEVFAAIYSEDRANDATISLNTVRKHHNNIDDSSRAFDCEQGVTKLEKICAEVSGEKMQPLKLSFCDYLRINLKAKAKVASAKGQYILKEELNMQNFIKKMRMIELYFAIKLNRQQRTILQGLAQRVNVTQALSRTSQREIDKFSFNDAPDPLQFRDSLDSLIQRNENRRAGKFDKNLAQYLGLSFDRPEVKSKSKARQMKDSHSMAQKRPKIGFKKQKHHEEMKSHEEREQNDASLDKIWNKKHRHQ